MNIFNLFNKKEDTTKNESRESENNECQAEVNQEQAAEVKDINKAKIYNLIIVDESGSMGGLEYVTVNGINETINTIRNAQKEFGETQQHYLTLVTFDRVDRRKRPDVRTLIDRLPIEKVKDFHDYQPYGNTPLYDAIGESVVALERAIKDDENAIGVVTVLTDGLENASRKYTAQDINNIIAGLKEKGWSFAYMGSAHNVKEEARHININQTMEFSHDQTGASDTWERERGARRNFYRKVEKVMHSDVDLSLETKRERMREAAEVYYGDRVTPNHVRRLNDNQVFVFGSNARGLHTGGASKYALEYFGAVMGQGEGMQGQSYAIPTTEGYEDLRQAIIRFAEYAGEHPDTHFLVTAIGCGAAGRTAKEVAPLFRNCLRLENVSLPVEFWEVLGLNI